MSIEWARRQLTHDEAMALAMSGKWKKWSDVQRARFQLFQRRLCMPFDVYHKAIEVALGRPVWTHEFADGKSLKDEWYGRINAPSMQEIIEKVPAEKRIIVELDGGK
jgi:hypothetical protein